MSPVSVARSPPRRVHWLISACHFLVLSAIVDGSGVLHDPNGIDRSELTRLAKARKTVSEIDRSKIGPGGYLILLEDKSFTLPSGEVIADGLTFRNTAHLRFKADMFVPCGGRPQAINLSNVNQLFDAEGKCHFKYIVEGANLFITQEARERLESKGIELYKDSSANKGGVTSSSQEVLAGLALNDEEYIANMLFKDGAPTPFYEAYVKDIQALIARNASAEFVALNKEYARNNGKVLRTRIADELASALNNLQAELETSALYEQVESRRNVLARAFPKTLIDFVGLDKLLERLPEPVSFRSQVAIGRTMLTTSTCPYSTSVPSGVSRSLPTLSLARVSVPVRSTFSSSSRHCPRDHWRSRLFFHLLSHLHHLHSDTSTISLRSKTSVLSSSHCHKTLRQYAFVIFSNFLSRRHVNCAHKSAFLVQRLGASFKRRRSRMSIQEKAGRNENP